VCGERISKLEALGFTIDRFEDTNPGESVARYEEIEKVLKAHFNGLRIRIGCAMSTLKSATPVKRARARPG
jgi:hypothetical protein